MYALVQGSYLRNGKGEVEPISPLLVSECVGLMLPRQPAWLLLSTADWEMRRAVNDRRFQIWNQRGNAAAHGTVLRTCLNKTSIWTSTGVKKTFAETIRYSQPASCRQLQVVESAGGPIHQSAEWRSRADAEYFYLPAGEP